MLDSAKECIFILDWWLSPEIYLRRPPAYYPEWRLDKVLQRAEHARRSLAGGGQRFALDSLRDRVEESRGLGSYGRILSSEKGNVR